MYNCSIESMINLTHTGGMDSFTALIMHIGPHEEGFR